MDEPQIPNTNETGESEKRDIDEVLDADIAGDRPDKPMEVDEALPSTSGGGESAPAELLEPNKEEVSETKAVEKEAGMADESIAETSTAEETLPEHDQTIEQINFDKPNESIDETLNYTEKSINISQIDMEHQHDDSNDAFDALKRDEIDVLDAEPIKEEAKEVEEEESKSEETPMETDQPSSPSNDTQDDVPPVEEPPLESVAEALETPSEQQEEVTTVETGTGDDDVHESTTQTETDEVSADKSPEGEPSEGIDERRPSEDIDESVASPAEPSSVEKPAEEVEDEETETTNEGM